MTKPTAFAEPVRFALSHSQARGLVTRLYRRFLKSANNVKREYGIPQSVPEIRSVIRYEFEKNRYVDDLRVINHLYSKGWMDLQETVNFWKQGPHILRYFDKKPEKPKDFLGKFLEGTA